MYRFFPNFTKSTETAVHLPGVPLRAFLMLLLSPQLLNLWDTADPNGCRTHRTLHASYMKISCISNNAFAVPGEVPFTWWLILESRWLSCTEVSRWIFGLLIYFDKKFLSCCSFLAWILRKFQAKKVRWFPKDKTAPATPCKPVLRECFSGWLALYQIRRRSKQFRDCWTFRHQALILPVGIQTWQLQTARMLPLLGRALLILELVFLALFAQELITALAGGETQIFIFWTIQHSYAFAWTDQPLRSFHSDMHIR